MSNLRLYEVAVTKEYSGGVPIWTNAVIYTVPEGATAFSFAAFGNTQYAARSRSQDVFGQYSAWSSYSEHTSTAGADSLTTSALDHTITETEISDNAISTPKLQANSVTAGKMTVGYNGSGNLLADGDFSWYGIGDTQYWSLGTDWSIIAASATSLYEHGRYRMRYNRASPAAASYATSLQPIRTADHHVFSLAILHRIETITNGNLSVEVLEYNAAGVLQATTALAQWSSTTVMDVDGWVIAGNAYTVPTGVTVDLTLQATTDYIIIRFVGDAASVANWYIMSASATAGYLPTLSSNTGSYYSAVDITAGGIIIYNGKLIFQDEYGQTAMDGYGFGGGWLKFINNGVYNGDFAAGSTSDIAVSETGSGTPTANYKASISQDLPHWVVAMSDGTVKLVSDSTASGGYSLHFQQGPGQTNRVYQDIPITPGMWPMVLYEWRVTAPGSEEVQFNKYFSYRASDHSIIGAQQSSGLVYTNTTTVYVDQWDVIDVGAIFSGTTAPSEASYVRIEFEAVGNVGTTDLYFNEVRCIAGNLKGRSARLASDTLITLGDDEDHPLVIGDTSGDNIGIDGAHIQSRYTTDFASTLYINSLGGGVTIGTSSTDITIPGQLRLEKTTDASLSSTGHAFQVGLTSGANIVMDGNEILARNNGSAAALNLNVEGNWVTINNTSGPSTTGGLLIAGEELTVPHANWFVADNGGSTGGSFTSRGNRSGTAGAGTGNDWVKVMSGTCTSQYQDNLLVGYVSGWGQSSNYDGNAGLVQIRVKQQAALGNQPTVEIGWLSRGFNVDPADICVNVSSVSGSATNYDLYVRSQVTYEYVYFLPIQKVTSGANGWYPVVNQTFAASMPAGTKYYGIDRMAGTSQISTISSGGGSSFNVTITTAGSYYASASGACAFTPQWAGQRFLLIATGAVSLNTSTAQYTLVRGGIGTTTTAQDIVSGLGYSRAYSNTSSAYYQYALVDFWTSDRTSTCYWNMAYTASATSGAVMNVAYHRHVAVSLD